MDDRQQTELRSRKWVPIPAFPCKAATSVAEGFWLMNPEILRCRVLRSKVMAQILGIGRLLMASTVLCGLISTASAEWNEQVLYSFQGGTDGATPTGAVVFDKAGNLYGATQNGGASTCLSPYNCGTVYRLTPPAQTGGVWTETVLYVFRGYAAGDGATPEGGLVIDDAGNLYGVTGYGGTGTCLLLGGAVGCGTVYELSPPIQAGDPWTETVLYSFQNVNDGYVGYSDLVFDKAGNLYGATLFGGGKGTTCDSLYGGQCGTVFELSPPKVNDGHWTEKVLHRFAGPPPGAQYGDGALPNGGLVLDSAGVVYGTTYQGGNNVQGQCEGGTEGTGCGTVFALVPPAKKGGQWTEKLLHVFRNGEDGSQPGAGLVFDSEGSLYGGAEGGAKGGGIVFRLTPTSSQQWSGAVLYEFALAPDGGVAPTVAGFDRRGNLYGTTGNGPSELLDGSVFRLSPRKEQEGVWAVDILHGFTSEPDGTFPNPQLVSDRSGNIYGTTQFGGANQSCYRGCGAVFEVSQ